MSLLGGAASRGRHLRWMAAFAWLGVACASTSGDRTDDLWRFHQLREQGRVELSEGRLAEALETLHEAEALKPGDPYVNLHLGTILLQLNRPNDAEPHLKTSLETARDGPARAKAYLQLAVIQKDRGDRVAAILNLERASVANPLDPVVPAFLSELYFQIGKRDRCLRNILAFHRLSDDVDPRLLSARDRAFLAKAHRLVKMYSALLAEQQVLEPVELEPFGERP